MSRRESIDKGGDIEAQILTHLQSGPVLAFGSDRRVDAVLQRLKKQGVVRYVSKKNGGNGWTLVREVVLFR
jgi:hypothetical protein